MAANFAEFFVRDAALNWLELRGFAVLCLSAPQRIASRQTGGPDIADGEPGAERSDPNYRDMVPTTFISRELQGKVAKRQVEAPA